MLVLSRKSHEQVLIPGLDVTITVLEISGTRVRLGIQAPQHIQITRPETQRPPTAAATDRQLRRRLVAELV